MRVTNRAGVFQPQQPSQPFHDVFAHASLTCFFPGPTRLQSHLANQAHQHQANHPFPKIAAFQQGDGARDRLGDLQKAASAPGLSAPGLPALGGASRDSSAGPLTANGTSHSFSSRASWLARGRQAVDPAVRPVAQGDPVAVAAQGVDRDGLLLSARPGQGEACRALHGCQRKGAGPLRAQVPRRQRSRQEAMHDAVPNPPRLPHVGHGVPVGRKAAGHEQLLSVPPRSPHEKGQSVLVEAGHDRGLRLADQFLEDGSLSSACCFFQSSQSGRSRVRCRWRLARCCSSWPCLAAAAAPSEAEAGPATACRWPPSPASISARAWRSSSRCLATAPAICPATLSFGLHGHRLEEHGLAVRTTREALPRCCPPA